MVGVGGTGTFLLDPLIRYLRVGEEEAPWQLTLIDGDEITEHNLERQLFAAQDVHVNKAAAASRPYRHLGRRILWAPVYIGRGNITEYIHDGDVVFICADNYKVRNLIEEYCSTLDNVVVINGGNEFHTGSCQLWIRYQGESRTPPLSFMHPEIKTEDEDRSELSCQQIAELPGGEQLIMANMMSACWMLNALRLYEVDRGVSNLQWHEVQFDLNTGKTDVCDYTEVYAKWRRKQMEVVA